MAEPTLLELISGGRAKHGGTGKYKEEEGAVGPLTESKLFKEWVLPIATGVPVAEEGYQPGLVEMAFALPVIGVAGRLGLNISKVTYHFGLGQAF